MKYAAPVNRMGLPATSLPAGAAQLARMPPVMMPGIACGRTMRTMVSQFGRTQRQAGFAQAFVESPATISSVATMTTGSVISASVSEAQRIAGYCPESGWERGSGWRKRIHVLADEIDEEAEARTNRNTMEGTPARLFTAPRESRG